MKHVGAQESCQQAAQSFDLIIYVANTIPNIIPPKGDAVSGSAATSLYSSRLAGAGQQCGEAVQPMHKF